MALKPPSNIYGVTTPKATPNPTGNKTISPIANNVATKNKSAATSVGKGASPSLPPLGQQASPMPAYNAPDPFKFDYNYLTYDTAKQRAEDRYNPLFQQAVSGVKDQQYQNELSSGESAANRGMAHSGLAQDALTKIAIASQGQIAGLNAQKMSDVADYSQNLLDKDLDRGDRLRSQMFAEYDSNRNFGYNQYRDQVGDSQWKSTYDRGVFESDRGYNYQAGRDKINDTRYTDETKYNRGQDSIHNGQWDKQFNADQYWKNKEWNDMSEAEKKRMAMDFANSMKLKKARGADDGPGGYAPGIIANNPGELPISMEEIMRILQGNNYSANSNYGRQKGTTSRATQSPENKKPHPLMY